MLEVPMASPVVLAQLSPPSPTEILGPIVVGGISEAILQGLLLSQLIAFVEKPTNNHVLRWAVYGVNAVSLAQVLLTGYTWWSTFVDNFGNSGVLVGYPLQPKIQSVLTVSMSGPVHGYFIYRCWMSTGRNWLVAIFLTLGVTLSIVTACLMSASAVVLGANSANVTFRLIYQPAVNTWLISSAVIDMTITVILLTYLIHSRRQTRSRYLTSLIDRLIVLVWQSAFPPSLCAIGLCIVSGVATLRDGVNTHWSTVPGELLGKFYCLSLMITVNSRDSLTQQVDVTDPHAPTTLPGAVFDLRSGLQKSESIAWSTTVHTVEDVHTPDSQSSAGVDFNGREAGATDNQKRHGG